VCTCQQDDGGACDGVRFIGYLRKCSGVLDVVDGGVVVLVCVCVCVFVCVRVCLRFGLCVYVRLCGYAMV